MFSLGRGGVMPCLAAVALASSGAGCAAHMRFVCPAHGGPEWREVATAHVVLRTDLDARRAEEMARELELMRALLAQALDLGEAAIPDRIEVVAMATQEEMADFVGTRKYAGEAIRDDLGRQQLLIAGLLTQDEQEIVVAHEMAHLLSAYAIPYQPRWFAEGLATYLSSVARIAADGSRAVGATPQVWIGEQLAYERQATFRELMSWSGATEPARYAASWLLVRTLATEHADGLAAFERGLMAFEPVAKAWNASFPEWSLDRPGGPEALDAILKTHAHDVSGSGRRVAVTVDRRVQARVLSPAEVHTARLDLARERRREAVGAEVEEALREDPGHVVALRWKAEQEPARALELSRRAVAAHPEDPVAWVLLARHLPPTEVAEREAALRKAVELVPDRTEERLELAWFMVHKNPTEAEILARAASERTPWSASARGVRAFALAALARCDDAKLLLDRSFELAGETADAEQVKAREKQRADLNRYCASALERKQRR